MPFSSLLRVLAALLVAGEITTEKIIDRLSLTLGRPWRWLRPLTQRYVKAFSAKTRPRKRDVVQFLRHDAGLRRAWSKHGNEISIDQWLSDPARMQPVTAAAEWDLPAIESTEELAAWLGSGLRSVSYCGSQISKDSGTARNLRSCIIIITAYCRSRAVTSG
jgi:hypothetical protein